MGLISNCWIKPKAFRSSMMICMALEELSLEVFHLGSLKCLQRIHLVQAHPSMEVHCTLPSSVLGLTICHVTIITLDINSLYGAL